MSKSMKTILFVDDEVNIRQSFADYFEDNNWQTLQAESGEDALEILKDVSPDAAVVDIRMGGMDGDLFIRKALKEQAKTGFVICTGSPEYRIPADLIKSPYVSGFLFRKPVTNMDTLEKELLRIIEGETDISEKS